MRPAGIISGLYVIVDNTARPDRSHEEIARAALRGGAKILQLRAKDMQKREVYEVSLRLRDLAADRGAVFIVNDHLDIALAVEADGVHLGQDDLPVKAAKRIAGDDFLMGVSTHSIDEALEAQRSGADYIGFGAVYPTASKERPTSPQGPERLGEIVKAVSIPVVAIGGITREKIPELVKTGAAGIAVISAITKAPDVEGEVVRFIKAWEQEISA